MEKQLVSDYMSVPNDVDFGTEEKNMYLKNIQCETQCTVVHCTAAGFIKKIRIVIHAMLTH